jgi:acetylornithine/N-succinyldiaminopimelate aminotransferase
VNDPAVLREVRFKGTVLKNALEKLAEQVPGAEVRGEGLLLGLDLADADLAQEVFQHCLDNGVLVNLVGGTTIRMAPPLTVSRTEVRAALDTFRGGVYAAMSAVENVPEAAVA